MMMKLWIDIQAMTGSSESLLRPGGLYAIKRLAELGYELAWDADALSPVQSELLANEQIVRSEFNSNDADAVVSTRTDTTDSDGTPEESQLTLTGSDSSLLSSGGDWTELLNRFLYPDRKASRKRTTKETDITVSLNIDGTGEASIDTGLKFFDHMLEQIARHGLIDLDIRCDGDLEIDEHHTIEDVAITLGEALYEAGAKNKTGIQRYGFLLAMDEAQAQVAIDLSNRPYLVWDADFSREYVGDFPLEMAEHFFHTLAMNLKATLQIRVEGRNDHHKLESAFKGFAKAFRYAVTRTERMQNILPSSKGAL